MKKRNIFLGLIVLGLISVVTVGCKDKGPEDSDSDDEVTPTTLTVDATAYDKWAYVSFVQGKVVEISDYKTDLSWDMALHRYDVRLNGGEAGKGKGAALKTTYTELSAVTSIPASGYITDVMDSISLSMPPTHDYQPVNHEASKWMVLNTTSMPPSYALSDNVFIFKTAEGKHVKIKFIDYINAEDVKAHIKFTYVYMD